VQDTNKGRRLLAIWVDVCYSCFNGEATRKKKHIIKVFAMLTVKEIATALTASEAAVEKAIVGMENINPSMLPEIKAKIDGGKLAAKNAPNSLATTGTNEAAPLAQTDKASAKRRTSKMKKVADAAALARTESSQVLTTQTEETQKPQYLDAMETIALEGFSSEDVVSAVKLQMSKEIPYIASLMCPQTVAAKTMAISQKLAQKQSAEMDAMGLTVEAIVTAAMPRVLDRPSLDDIFAAEMAALGL
jgi:hypothetical protein